MGEEVAIWAMDPVVKGELPELEAYFWLCNGANVPDDLLQG